MICGGACAQERCVHGSGFLLCHIGFPWVTVVSLIVPSVFAYGSQLSIPIGTLALMNVPYQRCPGPARFSICTVQPAVVSGPCMVDFTFLDKDRVENVRMSEACFETAVATALSGHPRFETPDPTAVSGHPRFETAVPTGLISLSLSLSLSLFPLQHLSLFSGHSPCHHVSSAQEPSHVFHSQKIQHVT